MANRVLLNNVDHAELRVAPGPLPQEAAVNQVIVLPAEYEAVQRDYPILFRHTEAGALQTVAVLGLAPGENLFQAEGGWAASHVPALLQRGPFLIGFTGPGTEGEPMIHIDLDDPRVGAESGQPLFLPQGGNAPYLEHVGGILRTIHAGREHAGPVAAALDAAGLIQPIDIKVNLGDAGTVVLDQYFTVAADRLAALDGEALERLHRAGALAAAFFIAASLGNMQRLIDRKLARGT